MHTCSFHSLQIQSATSTRTPQRSILVNRITIRTIVSVFVVRECIIDNLVPVREYPSWPTYTILTPIHRQSLNACTMIKITASNLSLIQPIPYLFHLDFKFVSLSLEDFFPFSKMSKTRNENNFFQNRS